MNIATLSMYYLWYPTFPYWKSQPQQAQTLEHNQNALQSEIPHETGIQAEAKLILPTGSSILNHHCRWLEQQGRRVHDLRDCYTHWQLEEPVRRRTCKEEYPSSLDCIANSKHAVWYLPFTSRRILGRSEAVICVYVPSKPIVVGKAVMNHDSSARRPQSWCQVQTQISIWRASPLLSRCLIARIKPDVILMGSARILRVQA